MSSVLHSCEQCGLPVALQHAYIDRHGDIKQLCGNCYDEALEGEESPELVKRDKRAALVLVLIGAALLLWMNGCATRPHKVETRIVNGKSIEIHTDAPSDLEPQLPVAWIGYYEAARDRIFLRSPVRQWVVNHELAHAEGMLHTAWVHHEFNRMVCATVVKAGGRYRVGQVICSRPDGEVVFTDSSMKEVV